MEETEDRKGRDQRANRWLVSNMTEHAEMESFVMAIAGSFNDEWGVEVWKKVSNAIEDKNKSINWNGPSRIQIAFRSLIPLVWIRSASDAHDKKSSTLPHFPLHSTTTHIQGEDVMHELSGRIAHLLETCKNRGLFASNEPWRKRMRACIETTASLVCCAGAELGQFGDIIKLLADIGGDQGMRESSLVGKDQLFVMRWTCLSLVAIRPILESDRLMRVNAQLAWKQLQGIEDDDASTADEAPLTRIQKIIQTFDNALGCLNELSNALILGENQTEQQVKAILRNNEFRISELEHIGDDKFQFVDWLIGWIQNFIVTRTHGLITHQLPGVKSDQPDIDTGHISQFAELFRGPRTFLFLFPVRNLKRIIYVAHTFRNILEGPWDVDAFREILEDLKKLVFLPAWENALHRQLWRLQDLSDGGCLAFTVKLFFLALKQLLYKSSSTESHSALYIGTFRVITSDWHKCKHSLGTQKRSFHNVAPLPVLITSTTS
jgi:hypothetical protein